MRRSFTRSSSRLRRSFDWDYAAFQLGHTNSGDAYATWLRIPSGGNDPFQNDNFIPAKTLQKTLISFYACTSPIPTGETGTLFLGIMAWNGIDESDPTDIPDAADGAAYDWLWWQPYPIVNVSGSSVIYQSNSAYNSDNGGIFSVSSQRKLPQGTGILLVSSWVCSASGADCYAKLVVRMGLKGAVAGPGLGSG